MTTKPIILFLIITFAACQSNQSIRDNRETLLDEGILNIIETDSGKVQTEFKTPFNERLQQLDISGLSITIIEDFKILETLPFGIRDSVNKVDKITLFQAASVSKLVTAVIVHCLVEDGVLALDADINEYLSHWKMP